MKRYKWDIESNFHRRDKERPPKKDLNVISRLSVYMCACSYICVFRIWCETCERINQMDWRSGKLCQTHTQTLNRVVFVFRVYACVWVRLWNFPKPSMDRLKCPLSERFFRWVRVRETRVLLSIYNTFHPCRVFFYEIMWSFLQKKMAMNIFLRYFNFLLLNMCLWFR